MGLEKKDTVQAEKQPAVEAFIADILEVYKKHGLSIAHEDNHGAFMVEDYYEYNVDWIKQARYNEA